MASKGKKSKTGATPGKLALVGVLVVILLIVLYLQFGGASESTSRSKRRAKQTSSNASVAVQPSGSTPAPSAPVILRPWPEISLVEATEHDPFALPVKIAARMQQREQEEQQQVVQETANVHAQTLAEFRQNGVSLVYRGKGQYLAQIGQATIRVGDVLDGFRVVEIGPKGVRLENDEGRNTQ